MRKASKIILIIYLIIPIIMLSSYLPVKTEGQILTNIDSSKRMKDLPVKVAGLSLYNESWQDDKGKMILEEVKLFEKIYSKSRISKKYGIEIITGTELTKNKFEEALAKDFYIMYSGEGRLDSVYGPQIAVWDDDHTGSLIFMGYNYIYYLNIKNYNLRVIFLSACYSMNDFHRAGKEFNLKAAFHEIGAKAVLGFKGQVALWAALYASFNFWQFYLLGDHTTSVAFNEALKTYHNLLSEIIVESLDIIAIQWFFNVYMSALVTMFNTLITLSNLDNHDIYQEFDIIQAILNTMYNLINGPEIILYEASSSYNMFDAVIYGDSAGYWPIGYNPAPPNNGIGKPPRFGTPTIDGVTNDQFNGV